MMIYILTIMHMIDGIQMFTMVWDGDGIVSTHGMIHSIMDMVGDILLGVIMVVGIVHGIVHGIMDIGVIIGILRGIMVDTMVMLGMVGAITGDTMMGIIQH